MSAAGPDLAAWAPAEYLLGFPMLVAVAYENRSPNVTLNHLPGWTPLGPRAPLDFVFVDESGKKVVIAAPFSAREEPEGAYLLPGTSRRMLYDLSLLNPRLEPGSYRLSVVYRSGGRPQSKEVALRVARPSPADARAAGRLLAPLQDKRWSDFLSANFRTVELPPLSKAARSLVAYHAALHRLVYDRTPLAQLDDGRAALLDEVPAPFAAEAAALRYELKLAHRDPAAPALRTATATRHPGIAHSLDEIDRGIGLIGALRESFGAEVPLESKPAKWPYQQ